MTAAVWFIYAAFSVAVMAGWLLLVEMVVVGREGGEVAFGRRTATCHPFQYNGNEKEHEKWPPSFEKYKHNLKTHLRTQKGTSWILNLCKILQSITLFALKSHSEESHIFLTVIALCTMWDSENAQTIEQCTNCLERRSHNIHWVEGSQTHGRWEQISHCYWEHVF